MQDITGKTEQPAAALGFGHLVDGEAQSVQVLDQVGPPAWISDSGSFQRFEVERVGRVGESDTYPSVPAADAD
ncbi:hypothetical protein NIIDMKKI_27570 [Mycobacterium kansasii]|uniref:Uncharacterized protein n=1 Tax=Mycobacterium kansasii TaxID=1768 RepID=A0A7G1I961_MYCKA|nr:hypothetical protein NIIDMKKI_27570 [Mycobacterium kansasii]